MATELTSEVLGPSCGFSLDGLKGFLAEDAELSLDTVVHPRLRTVPMGFSWASFLAQSTMIGCLADVCDVDRQVLSDAGVPPCSRGPTSRRRRMSSSASSVGRQSALLVAFARRYKS